MELFSDAWILGRISRPTLVDGALWVVDSRAPFLHVVDTASGQVIASVGRAGDGPEEFTNVVSIVDMKPEDGWVTIWDGMKRRLVTLESGCVGCRGTELRAPSPVPHSRIGFMYTFTEDRILTTWLASGNQPYTFATLAADGTLMSRFSIGLSADTTVSVNERRRGLAAPQPCSRWDRRGFAIASSFANRIVFYDTAATPVDTFRVPSPSEERFDFVDRSQERQFIPERFTYKTCTFAEQSMFVLYSGKLVSTIESDSFPTAARYVQEYTLSGDFIREFELDREVDAIAATRDGRTLFAVLSGGHLIYRIRVPARER